MPDSPPDTALVLRAAVLGGLPHAFSERRGGVSPAPYASLNLGPRTGDAPEHLQENRRRFLAAAGVAGRQIIAPRQTHSASVAAHHRGAPLPPAGVFDGDGVVTNAPGTAVMILAADCVPVLLADPARDVVAAVHAGWRGTAGGIARQAVAVMRSQFGCAPGELRAALGPAIGGCCYEVGPEVVTAVDAATPSAAGRLAEPRPAGKFLLDLHAANAAQLLEAGLAPAQIERLPLCTSCHVDRFFSHRRERGLTGRGGALIGLP